MREKLSQNIYTNIIFQIAMQDICGLTFGLFVVLALFDSYL